MGWVRWRYPDWRLVREGTGEADYVGGYELVDRVELLAVFEALWRGWVKTVQVRQWAASKLVRGAPSIEAVQEAIGEWGGDIWSRKSLHEGLKFVGGEIDGWVGHLLSVYGAVPVVAEGSKVVLPRDAVYRMCKELIGRRTWIVFLWCCYKQEESKFYRFRFSGVRLVKESGLDIRAVHRGIEILREVGLVQDYYTPLDDIYDGLGKYYSFTCNRHKWRFPRYFKRDEVEELSKEWDDAMSKAQSKRG